jgi:hypothetical protein
MKRFGLWLTVGIMFSLPALVFAQATGGSTDSKIKEGGAVKNTGGKKVVHPEVVRKGTPKAPTKTGTGNTPALESKIGQNYEAGTGKKGRVVPTAKARKKPPRPEKAPDPK